jgi:mRNA-degrading endonuclease RelE of RelBE toxin-antitoxin system
MHKKYKIRTLPGFDKDLEETLDNISSTLQKPAAAQLLLAETRKSIKERSKTPLSFEQYHSKKDRKTTYYRIRVRNYTIYYVVIDDVMELRRFVYGRRNIDALI